MNIMGITWGPDGFYMKFHGKYVDIAWVKAGSTLCK